MEAGRPAPQSREAAE